MTEVRMVLYPNPLIAAEGSSLIRTSPRPAELRQPDYEEKFDHRTVFYDVFRRDDRVVLSGPPLRNLLPKFETAVFTDGAGRKLKGHFRDMDRTQHSWLAAPSGADLVTVHLPEVSHTSVVGPDLSGLFAGRQALLTKSKDNRLEWIRDWATFHVANHGIDSVLLYDNASTTYKPEDVLAALHGISGLDVVVIVHWPFPFGPQGGNWGGVKGAPWDSDYCEYGILEHARSRFLHEAEGVIQLDIDELLVAEGGESAFDVLARLGGGAATFSGRWIETLGAEPGKEHSFADFRYHDTRRGPTTRKWIMNPRAVPGATQWRTHDVAGTPMKETPKLMHRHFMGISSNWKFNRTAPVEMTEHHVLDEELARALATPLGSHIRLERVEVVRPLSTEELFDQLKRGIEQGSNADLDPVRVWLFRDNILVYDFDWDGTRVGFDFHLTAERLKLTAVGRGSEAGTIIDRVKAKSGISLPPRPGRIELVDIEHNGSLDGIANVVAWTMLELKLEVEKLA